MIMVATQVSAAKSAVMTIFFVFVCIVIFPLYFLSNIVYTISDHITITNSGENYITR